MVSTEVVKKHDENWPTTTKYVNNFVSPDLWIPYLVFVVIKVKPKGPDLTHICCLTGDQDTVWIWAWGKMAADFRSLEAKCSYKFFNLKTKEIEKLYQRENMKVRWDFVTTSETSLAMMADAEKVQFKPFVTKNLSASTEFLLHIDKSFETTSKKSVEEAELVPLTLLEEINKPNGSKTNFSVALLTTQISLQQVRCTDTLRVDCVTGDDSPVSLVTSDPQLLESIISILRPQQAYCFSSVHCLSPSGTANPILTLALDCNVTSIAFLAQSYPKAPLTDISSLNASIGTRVRVRGRVHDVPVRLANSTKFSVINAEGLRLEIVIPSRFVAVEALWGNTLDLVELEFQGIVEKSDNGSCVLKATTPDWILFCNN